MELLFLFVLRRDVGVARRGGLQVGGDVSVDFAEGPANSAAKQIDEKRILPIFRAVADGSVKDAAFTVHTRTGSGVRAALVAFVFEFAGVDGQNDVEVGHKVFHRIPLFVEFDGRGYAFEARKFRIVDDQAGGLQARVVTVNDEFAAEHAEIRIGFFTVGDVARG